MKISAGISRESADILGDVIGTDEYNAVPAAEPGAVDDGNFADDSIATEDGNADAGGVEGETSDNVIEDQDDLDLTNAEGGEYDASEGVETSTEDGDAVDIAFDAIDTDDTGTTDGGEGGDTGTTDDTGGDAGGEGGDDTGSTDDGGEGVDGDDISVAVDTGTTDDTGTDGGEGGEGGDTGTTTDDGEGVDNPPPAASDVPIETVDTDESGLTDEQVKQGAEAVESYFSVIDRRAARSFEDGAETILDEPEIADADLPVPADDGTGTCDDGTGTTECGDTSGDGADIGGGTDSTVDDGTGVVDEPEIADLGSESFSLF